LCNDCDSIWWRMGFFSLGSLDWVGLEQIGSGSYCVKSGLDRAGLDKIQAWVGSVWMYERTLTNILGFVANKYTRLWAFKKKQ
jgi:hypothetical protein